ncbi:MAG: hypothetical protein VW080_09995 [Flavobacteriaceae bacterium]
MLWIGGVSHGQISKTVAPYVLIVQPIVLQSDEGTDPASIMIPEDLVDQAYQKAGVDFRFLEPIYFNHTQARDGLINLDSIVVLARQKKLIKGQDDLINMFFVNAVDGQKGPLGRGMMGGNLTFISLGDSLGAEDRYLQAFVIAHEVGHNLSLKHAAVDKKVPTSIPNLQGEGEFKYRVDPKYSLNPYQIRIIHQSPLIHPRVDFLDSQRGSKAILDESYEPYFSQLQIREIEAFTQSRVPSSDLDSVRRYAKEKFADAVVNFTEDEKERISFVLNKVHQTLIENDLHLMADQPWRFIKIEDWLCGGFAHTRGTYIILSQRHIDHLTQNWSTSMSAEDEQQLVEKMGKLLVHEQMHSLQRTFKSKFDVLYSDYWNFQKAQVTHERQIALNQVSNPDAPVAEWLIPHPTKANEFFWIRTLLKETQGIPQMGKDFVDTVFTVKEKMGVFTVEKSKKNVPITTDLDKIAFYKNAFPVSRGIDHPNEISAYLFADYFQAILTSSKPFPQAHPNSSKNSKRFIQWIQENMNK